MDQKNKVIGVGNRVWGSSRWEVRLSVAEMAKSDAEVAVSVAEMVASVAEVTEVAVSVEVAAVVVLVAAAAARTFQWAVQVGMTMVEDSVLADLATHCFHS